MTITLKIKPLLNSDQGIQKKGGPVYGFPDEETAL